MDVLLLAKPGPLRDGLDALLYATPEVRIMTHTSDIDASLGFLKHSPAGLVILRIRPGDQDLLAKVPDIRELCPQGQVVVFVDDVKDQGIAEASGADVVLLSGIPAAKLKDVIKGLTAH